MTQSMQIQTHLICVIKDANAQGSKGLSNIDNLTPWLSTMDKNKQMINERHVSLEMLASIMDSDTIDDKKLKDLYSDLKLNALNKGFKSRFSKIIKGLRNFN